MKNLMILILLFTSAGLFTSCNEEQEAAAEAEITEAEINYDILVFSKTAGWRHEAIEAGQEAIKELGEQHNAAITISEDAELFNPDTLEQYDAIVFLNTTETVFNDDQREAFESYIQSGGGFVGVHSATDTEYDWPWYGELVGAYFDSHPNNPNVRAATVQVQNPDHPATTMLPEEWEREDEWYNFSEISDQINVLLTLDTNSYEGSDHPDNHPISWYHEYDGGRAFYTGLGHTDESYSEDLFLQHLWGGILYAMGEAE